jgi:hypothetical protein
MKKIKKVITVAPRRQNGFQPTRARRGGNERLENTGLAALRGTVLSRVHGAVRKLVENSPERELHEALIANTAMDTLIHLVSREHAAAEVALNVDDPLRAAKARAARQMSALLSAEGGPIGVEEAAKRLRITRAAVDKRRKTGTLIGIEDGGRAVLYPNWQFTSTGLLPGLGEALRAIGVSDPWMRMQFFLRLDPDLGMRPLDALRACRLAEVARSAKHYGRQGEDEKSAS